MGDDRLEQYCSGQEVVALLLPIRSRESMAVKRILVLVVRQAVSVVVTVIVLVVELLVLVVQKGRQQLRRRKWWSPRRPLCLVVEVLLPSSLSPQE